MSDISESSSIMKLGADVHQHASLLANTLHPLALDPVPPLLCVAIPTIDISVVKQQPPAAAYKGRLGLVGLRSCASSRCSSSDV